MLKEPFGPEDELRRVLESKAFSGADVSRRLLTYLVGSVLSGKSKDLKEYTVGIEAFGKPEGYDPQVDPTVRVHAGKLRQRLLEYYRGEGSSDPLQITFPKGHFCLYFEPQNQNDNESPELPNDNLRQWKIATACAIGVSIFALLALVLQMAARSKSAIQSKFWTPEIQAIWGPLVEDNAPIQIAYETVMFIRIPNATFRAFGIEEPSDVPASKDAKLFLQAFGNPKPTLEHNYAGFGAVQGIFSD